MFKLLLNNTICNIHRSPRDFLQRKHITTYLIDFIINEFNENMNQVFLEIDFIYE